MTKNQKKFVLIFGIVGFFWIFAHGYRFMNNLHTSDSLVSVFQDDILWQRSLGRFMQTFTFISRGTIAAPWLIMIISILFFSGAIYLMDKMLNIKSIAALAVMIGILVCNVTWTTAVACYLPWVDIYSVALFLATLGCWFCKKDKVVGYLLGSICFILSLGFYQAYIDVAFALIFITSIIELTELKDDLRNFIFRLIKQLGCLGISGVLYYVLFLMICKIHHVELAISYNSISNINDFSKYSLPSLFINAYAEVFRNLWNPGKFVSTILADRYVSDMWIIVLRICLVANVLIIVGGLVYINIKMKTKWGARILQILGVVTLPLVLNFVYIMSKGMEYELMIFSFFFIFVLEILVLEKMTQFVNKKKLLLFIGILPVVAYIWSNIVYSNQVYFKIDMEDRAALSQITRLVDDIEKTEGYIESYTPVVFVGNIEHASSSVIYLKDLTVHGNLETPFSFGQRSISAYICYYLARPMNIPNTWDVDQEIEEQLEVYPKEGSIKIIDDVLYVKLSDE